MRLSSLELSHVEREEGSHLKLTDERPTLNGLTEGMNGKETQNLLGLEKPNYFTEPFIEFQPLLGSSFNSLDHSIIVGDTEGCMRMAGELSGTLENSMQIG